MSKNRAEREERRRAKYIHALDRFIEFFSCLREAETRITELELELKRSDEAAITLHEIINKRRSRIDRLEREAEMFKAGLQAADDKLIELQAQLQASQQREGELRDAMSSSLNVHCSKLCVDAIHGREGV
jgi:chromosome segregation ATPase